MILGNVVRHGQVSRWPEGNKRSTMKGVVLEHNPFFFILEERMGIRSFEAQRQLIFQTTSSPDTRG